MAGHSKWANIKHKKAKVDAKRGKVFTKLIKDIVVAAKHGGGDLDTNPNLRLAVEKARAENMKKDTIENAIARGAGTLEGDDLQEVRYEGYGPEGVAVMVDCLTDNRNRTVAEVRHAFSKCGGNLGTDGSVAYLFTKIGFIAFEPGSDEDTIMELAIEAGANDVITEEDGSIEVLTDPEQVMTVREALIKGGLKPAITDVMQQPANYIEITDPEVAEKMQRLQDWLEDLDDVQSVHTNAQIDAGLLG